MTKTLRSLGATLMVLAGSAAAHAADIPVRYTVDEVALKSVTATTPLTFTLYTEESCVLVAHSEVVAAADVTIISRLKRLTPKTAPKAPKTDELVMTLTNVQPVAPLYLAVTGAGIVPVGGTCQAQASGAQGETSGWTDDGAVVRLTGASDSVGIGTVTPSATLHVVGSTQFGSNAIPLLRTDPSNDITYLNAQTQLIQPGIGDSESALLVYTANGFDLMRGDTLGRRVSVGPGENGETKFAVFSTEPQAVWIADPTGSTTYMIVDGSTGRVGIGTQTPSATLEVDGDLVVTGTKSFDHRDPDDPSRLIRYVALEGPEAGTYARGSGTLVDGEAVIELPEHFGSVTSAEGLTAQLTPREQRLELYVADLTTQRLVVRDSTRRSGRFDYLVQGIRRGYEDFKVVRSARDGGKDDPVGNIAAK